MLNDVFLFLLQIIVLAKVTVKCSFGPSHLPRHKFEIFKISLFGYQNNYFTIFLIYKTTMAEVIKELLTFTF